MTPTLRGRWQTRILLMGTIGSLITLPFALGLVAEASDRYWIILGMVTGLGVLVWDPWYNFLQTWRWDRDWPALFQLMAGIWEGFFVYVPMRWLLAQANINWLDNLDLGVFAVHYGLVWLGVFTSSQTLMRIIFPRWRFRGGQWL